jgi:hypothetical protein
MNPSNAFVPPVGNNEAETSASDKKDNDQKPRKKRLVPNLINPWLSTLPVMWFSDRQAGEEEKDAQPEQKDKSDK